MAEAVAIVDMLDTIGPDAGNIPRGTRKVAAYITGRGIAWTPAQIAALAKRGVQTVLRIDQTNAVLMVTGYLVKDIEPGASSVQTALKEATSRKLHGLRTCFYFDRATMATVVSQVTAANLEGHIDYWVADWNLDRQQAIDFMLKTPNVKAVQWASPSSNPHTLAPGSKRTLAELNVDLSVTRADWPAPPPKPHPSPKPQPKITAAMISGALTTALLALLNKHGVHVTHLTAPEASAISVASAVLAGYFKSNG